MANKQISVYYDGHCFYTPGPASSAPLPEFCPGASKAALVSAAVGAFEVPGPLEDPGPADGPGPALV